MLEKNRIGLDKKNVNFINLKGIFDEINNTLIGKEKNLIAENKELKERIEKLEKMIAELKEKVSKNESSSLNNNIGENEKQI